MSQITIQCRLVAPEEARKVLWLLATEKNTPLINELIKQVVEHPDFETWRQKGKHPQAVVAQICKELKTGDRFSGQPSRFYASAEKVVNYIFKSWLTLQKRLQNRLSGKQRWLEILQSDEELAEICGHDLETIRKKATQVLTQVKKAIQKSEAEQAQNSKKPSSVSQSLFKKYYSAKQPLTRCAVAYLLKNGCKLPTQPEDPKKIAARRRKAERRVQKLQEQLENRIPKGRDLTGQSWLDILTTATTTVPKDDQEHKQWQDQLLKKSSTAPFPIVFETNEDLVWFQNEKGLLSVHFNGLSEHSFQIYCDQRQLRWFNRFLDDQETKRQGKNQHTSALFALRSARICWKENDKKSKKPWDCHYLTLYCTIDTRAWSAEGTEEIRQEKASDVADKLTKLNEKGDLSKTQAAYARRLSSTLKKLDVPFNRPSRPRYQGKSHIIAGVSLGWDNLLTLVIWNTLTQEVIVYRSLKQLLGKDYKLFIQQRQQQQAQAHKRHKAQKRNEPIELGSSNLGQHVDRLLAKAVVAIAKEFNAGSIAIPQMTDIRTLLQAEIEERAAQKIPGYLEGQKRYAKQYKINIHKWSYSRLLGQIVSNAAQVGIVIEESSQPFSGTPQEKAKAVAIAAYELRSVVL